VKRGRCPICGYSCRLLKSGALASHWLYSGRDHYRCNGSGEPPSRQGCDTCITKAAGLPTPGYVHTPGSAASTRKEAGK
jgi:hypothetical protein